MVFDRRLHPAVIREFYIYGITATKGISSEACPARLVITLNFTVGLVLQYPSQKTMSLMKAPAPGPPSVNIRTELLRVTEESAVRQY